MPEPAPPEPGPLLTTLLHDPARFRQLLTDTLAAWCVPAALVAAALLAAATGVCWWRHQQQQRWQHGAHTVTVLLPAEVDPSGATAFWDQLAGLSRPWWRRLLHGQPHLAFEYLFSHDGTTIQIWVPGPIPTEIVAGAVRAAWPGAQTRTHPAAAPLPHPTEGHQLRLSAGQLRPARPDALPVRSEFPADPLRAVLGTQTGLSPDQHACVQILARPASRWRLARTRRARHTDNTSRNLLLAALDLLTPTGGHPRGASTRPRDPQASLELSSANRAVVGKQRGNHFDTRVRYAASTRIPTDEPHPASRAQTRHRAHALATAFASYTELNHFRRRLLPRAHTVLTQRHLHRGDVLHVPEIAALAHLPTDEAIPGLHRAGARSIAAPPGIATPSRTAIPLGDTDTTPSRPVALRIEDARYHLHVQGATGSGKSTLLAGLVLDHIHAGRGVLVIDPKGDLATDIHDRLPEHARNRLVLFDAESTGTTPCLNPLDGTYTDLSVDNLVSVFRRVYAAYWGPRTDDVMRAGCLTLRTQPTTTTLADLVTLLTDPAYRARVTSAVTDPVLQGFWSWFDSLSDAAQAQATAPLMNKLRGFLLRPFVRDALAAGPSTVNLTDVLDGGVCLVRIPKGALGEETARLVGSLLVAHAWQATTGRVSLPQEQRRDAAMVIDECHNFLNLPYPMEDMLAEARGFRVSLVLAHQHLGQLPRELHDGISANARNKIFFSAGPDDARQLARHTAPTLSEHDLSHLGAYHVAARLVLHGEHTRPFTLTTRPLPAVENTPDITPQQPQPTPAPAPPASPASTRQTPPAHDPRR